MNTIRISSKEAVMKEKGLDRCVFTEKIISNKT